MVTNLYGPHNAEEKRDFIKSLRKIQERMDSKHWVLGGDLNLITSLEEKKGGQCRLEEECETFRDTIEELRLAYITLGEGWFTWKNNRMRDIHISSFLDNFLVSKSILELGSELH